MLKLGGLGILAWFVGVPARAQHSEPRANYVTAAPVYTQDVQKGDANDTALLTQALGMEMQVCKPDGGESPRVRTSLENMRRASDSMIAQFTKMVDDEIVDKRGPLKIGPPEIMNEVLKSPQSMREFAEYKKNLKYISEAPPYQEGQPKWDPQKYRLATQKFENEHMAICGGPGAFDKESLLRAAELGDKLNTTFFYRYVVMSEEVPKNERDLIAFERSRRINTANNYLGVVPDGSPNGHFFSSLEDVAPSLPQMNDYLEKQAASRAKEQQFITALVDGASLAVSLNVINVAKGGLSKVVKTMTESASGGDTSGGKPVPLLLLITMGEKMRDDFASLLTSIGSQQLKNGMKSAAGFMPPDPASNSASLSDLSGSTETSDTKAAVLSALPKIDGPEGSKVAVPEVEDPAKFTMAMMKIRDLTKAYANDPTLLDANGDSKNVQASSGKSATLETLSDTRVSNDDLVNNLQSFYNTSRRAGADFNAIADCLTEWKRTGKECVQMSVVKKTSDTLDPDLNEMLGKMDDSTSILANQSRNFATGIAAIQEACDRDARKVYDSWGKYQNLFRDKHATPVSPAFVGFPESPAKAYLAEAVLVRADCVRKKSIARRLEMMRLGTVLSQFKTTCQQVKKWDVANAAYKQARSTLMKSPWNVQKVESLPTDIPVAPVSSPISSEPVKAPTPVKPGAVIDPNK